MAARVWTHGGENNTIKHWTLQIDGRDIAFTSIPSDGELFERIAARVERGEASDGRSSGFDDKWFWCKTHRIVTAGKSRCDVGVTRAEVCTLDGPYDDRATGSL